ncbi:osmotically-inducible protein OsmY [Litorimonas taeanensis]|uniref:Osmotically-inducible protein OsmY n=1 Tax=Litorimonas taeanensis TaxID=568099 RepID=A0A420WES2_9PROT|nr:BON domain-containing protein [Litorimonas taeanensis]RKQ69476.1 osmotically-inducible protein OsmY [Litorimonas taeanensis]
MKHFALPLLCTALLTGLSGCAVTTAGIKKGDERNFARSLNDVNAGRAIKARMMRAYDFSLKGVDVEVAEGVVLLTGNVPSKADRIEAARIAWSAPLIDQVGNEIFIKDKQSFTRNAKDGVLEKTIRTRLLAETNVKSRNFNIETHDGIVYLMGVARSAGELELAAKIAAETRGAVEVISYARIADMSQMARLDAMEGQVDYTERYQGDYPSYDPYPQAQSAQRAVPGFLSTTPPVAEQPTAPIQSVPLGQPIPLKPIPAPQDQAYGPTAPAQLNLGDRMNKELPTDEELGAYRTGQAGETISEIQSEPYYLDPETGEQIPVTFKDGVVYPRLIK